MKASASVLLCALLGIAIAQPNNYYHQEYNYKTSASSYKNNELQHKKDDEGFMSKDGDLEGRVDPIVNSHAQHSEYINPKLKNQNLHLGGSNSDQSSFGQMDAEQFGLGSNSYGSNRYGSNSNYRSNYGTGHNQYSHGSDGVASSDHIIGSRSGYSYAGAYGVGGSSSLQDYGMNSNLRGLTQRLQEDISRQLQSAVSQSSRSHSSYGSSLSMQQLEEELRRNLTMRLQDALQSQYGQQSIKGGHSYTISNGRVQSTANYDNQELNDLTRLMENNLMNQLRNQYSQIHHSSSSSSSSSSNYQYSTQRPIYAHGNLQYSSTARPYYPVTSRIGYYSTPAYYSTPGYYSTPTYPSRNDYSQYSSSNQRMQSASNIRYTPISNPESITTIATRIQTNLNEQLNNLLSQLRHRYFSNTASSTVTSYDHIVNELERELRSNITYLIDDEIRRNYGNQMQRDGYMYTLGPNGQYSSESNYNLRDLENLKLQVEKNLVDKLNRDFQTYRNHYMQQKQSYSHSSSYGTNQEYYPSSSQSSIIDYGRYEDHSTRPTSPYLAPLIASGTKTHQNSYNYGTDLRQSNSQSNYQYGSGSYSNIADLQRQLQSDLSRQLQSAISRNQYKQSSGYSSSSAYRPQTYQVSYQELSDELSRNLTRQLQELMQERQYNSGSSAYSSFSSDQLADLKSQLQSNLQNQLRQGLQQSYSSHSSYSASSSSSSNYRPVRGYTSQQAAQSGAWIEGEDCQGDEPQHHLHKRTIRSYSHTPISHANQYSQQEQLDDDDYYTRFPSAPNDEDLTQQVEENSFEQLQVNHKHDDLGQQTIEVGEPEYVPVRHSTILSQQENDYEASRPTHTFHHTHPYHSAYPHRSNYGAGTYRQMVVPSASHTNGYFSPNGYSRYQPQITKPVVIEHTTDNYLSNDDQQQEEEPIEIADPTPEVLPTSHEEPTEPENPKVLSQSGRPHYVRFLAEPHVAPTTQEKPKRFSQIGDPHYAPVYHRPTPKYDEFRVPDHPKTFSMIGDPNYVPYFQPITVYAEAHRIEGPNAYPEIGEPFPHPPRVQTVYENRPIDTPSTFQLGPPKYVPQIYTQEDLNNKPSGTMNDELTQQRERELFQVGRSKPKKYSHFSSINQKPIDSDDLTRQPIGQQVELEQQLQVGQQQIDDSDDLTQQVEQNSFEQLQIGQKPVEIGQQPIDNDLNLEQQQEESSFEKLNVGFTAKPLEIGQQTIDDGSKLSQNVEQPSAQISEMYIRKPIDDVQKPIEINQRPTVEDTSFAPLHIGQQPIELGQKPFDDDDLIQRVEQVGNHPVPLGQKPIEIAQKPLDDDDLVQQVEQNSFEDLHVGNQYNQKPTISQQQIDNEFEQNLDIVTPKQKNQTLTAEEEADLLLEALRTASRHRSNYFNTRSTTDSQPKVTESEYVYRRHPNTFQRHYSSGNSNQHYSSQMHYGSTEHVVEEIEETSEIEPIEPQQASVVQSVRTTESSESYGSKGGQRIESPPDVEAEGVTAVDEIDEPTSTVKPGFWRRVGNKFTSLKEKIG